MVKKERCRLTLLPMFSNFSWPHLKYSSFFLYMSALCIEISAMPNQFFVALFNFWEKRKLIFYSGQTATFHACSRISSNVASRDDSNAVLIFICGGCSIWLVIPTAAWEKQEQKNCTGCHKIRWKIFKLKIGKAPWYSRCFVSWGYDISARLAWKRNDEPLLCYLIKVDASDIYEQAKKTEHTCDSLATWLELITYFLVIPHIVPISQTSSNDKLHKRNKKLSTGWFTLCWRFETKAH